jgi:hypothetical protein
MKLSPSCDLVYHCPKLSRSRHARTTSPRTGRPNLSSKALSHYPLTFHFPLSVHSLVHRSHFRLTDIDAFCSLSLMPQLQHVHGSRRQQSLSARPALVMYKEECIHLRRAERVSLLMVGEKSATVHPIFCRLRCGCAG